MKPSICLVLIASGLLMSACASSPSTVPISLPVIPPPACLSDCPPPPEPLGNRMQWEEQMLDWGYECRRRQSDCAGWVRSRDATGLTLQAE